MKAQGGSLGHRHREGFGLPQDEARGNLPEVCGADIREQTFADEVACRAEMRVGEAFEVRGEGFPVGSVKELAQTLVDDGMVVLVDGGMVEG